jgi:hypothetical protein
MRRFITCGLLAALALALAAPAMAQGDNKYAGVGFIVASPRVSMPSSFLNNEHALEFGLAWSLSGSNELHMQGDYLWHRYGLIDLKNGDEMPLFFGVGARFVVEEGDADDVFGHSLPRRTGIHVHELSIRYFHGDCADPGSDSGLGLRSGRCDRREILVLAPFAGTVTGGNYKAAVCDVDDRTRRFFSSQTDRQ